MFIFVFFIFIVVCLIAFFIYRIWDELPDLIMSMKEQNRELTKIREVLEKVSDSSP